MSGKDHFVIWKGNRIGPFTKEGLEREFAEGRMGLVRTVAVGGMTISGRDFVAELETRRREEELEEQLQQQVRANEAARLELERQQEEHRMKLEEASKRPSGKTTPPPIPETNPWGPQSPGGPSLPQRKNPGELIIDIPAPPFSPGKNPVYRASLPGWWDGNWPVIIAALLCLLCLMTGLILREITGIAALTFAVILMVRKRNTPGIILMLCALFCYGTGFLLSDLIHDYLFKNYPN